MGGKLSHAGIAFFVWGMVVEVERHGVVFDCERCLAELIDEFCVGLVVDVLTFDLFVVVE